MIVPGFEPGASALSEQRSNQAELHDLYFVNKKGFIKVFIDKSLKINSP